jgi:PKD domain
MTDQLILGTAAVVVALLIAYEVIETWRWRGYGNRPASRFRVIRLFRRAIGGFFSIVTLRRWRRRRVEPPWTMTSEDVARRLGDAPPGPVHMQPGRIVVSGSAPVMHPSMEPAQPIQPVQPMREPRSPRPSRLRLARDTIGAALVLGGFIVVFANIVPSGPPGPPDSSVLNETATPRPSAHVVVPGTPAPASVSPVAVAQSSEPFATPTGTPSSVAYLESPTPAPRATRTPQPPQRTAPPTAEPTATPRPSKSPKPPKTPAPTPPPPTVLFDISMSGCTATFTNSTVGAETYLWNFGDGATDSARNPVPHTYGGNGDFIVKLTATNSAGVAASSSQTARASCP